MELQEALRRFGCSSLRPGQREAFDMLLCGHDLLGVLPTGAGKSLCYQVPALLLGGYTLVISPLVALMRDQVDKLNQKGIPAAMLDAGQTEAERNAAVDRAAQGRLKLLYIAPERMASAAIQTLVQLHPPKLVVVDEAHCVLRWGESFRPVYLRIGPWLQAIQPRPQVCAMTATASPSLRRGIIRSLGMRRVRQLVLPVRRENLIYQVLWTLHPQKSLHSLLRRHPNEKTLIYCPTRRMTEQTADWLATKGYAAEAYHAGLADGVRRGVEERFRSGATSVLAATIAFGMGVDLPDIRLLVHLAPPASAEDYAQETGRAGRDGQPAVCVQLIHPQGCFLRTKLLQTAAEEAKSRGWRGRLQSRKRAGECDRMFDLLLRGACIPQGLERAFGQHGRPCGRCSGCMRQGFALRGRLRRFRLSTANKTGLRLWFLQVLCQRLQGQCPRVRMPPVSQLAQAARTLNPALLTCSDPTCEAALREGLKTLRNM